MDCAAHVSFGQQLKMGRFCPACQPIPSCSTCGMTGSPCFFFGCAGDGCNNYMCGCENFHAENFNERGGAPGCSFYLPPSSDDEDDDYASTEAEKKQYCEDCKPERAVEMYGYPNMSDYNNDLNW